MLFYSKIKFFSLNFLIQPINSCPLISLLPMRSGESSTWRSGLAGVNAQERKRMIAEMEGMWKEEKGKREHAEHNLLQYRRRSLQSEREFSRLLEKYDHHVATVNGRQSYSQEMFVQLLNTIEEFNTNSQNILEQRCDEVINQMGRRIHQILEKTEQEIKKSKKLSQEQYHEIKEEIKEALKLAEGVEVENIAIKKENKLLNFQVNVLREERSLMVEELNQKKLLLMRVAASLQEERKQSATSRMASSQLKGNFVSERMAKSTLPKFICEPSFKDSISRDNPTIDCPETPRRPGTQGKHKVSLSSRTEYHLNACLERERKRNSELKAVVAKLQSKVRQTSQSIQQCLSRAELVEVSKDRLQVIQKGMQEARVKLMVSGLTEHVSGISSFQLKSLLQA